MAQPEQSIGSEQTGPDEVHIEFVDVRLAFGERRVFDGLDCSFPRHRISVIMGGSGTGKSTILRMIGGLQVPDAGHVLVDGQDVVAMGNRALSQMRKNLGMQFQNGALLDSMSVFDNVALPLRERSQLSPAEIREKVQIQLHSVGLLDVEELLPGELSGGMLRRVAFARAIVLAPNVLLCDEPFSGLDPPNVTRIEALLRHLNETLGLTIIVTSHHMATSLRMADRLLLLQDGSGVGGTPAELAASRESVIRRFIGEDGSEFLARLHEIDPGGDST
jgi:phospholipid/cholesterol/gamma-HCH transport system ATP-binding protein